MQPDTFEGGAFHPSLKKGKASGTVAIGSIGIRFTKDQSSVEFPISGLTLELGGASDRVLFFRHPSFPEWTIYTADQRILKHPVIAHARELQNQIAKVRSKKLSARLILSLVLLVPCLLIGLLAVSKDAMVKKIAQQVPVSWEETLGDTAFTQIRVKGRLIEDPQLQSQLEQITRPLVEAIPGERYRFKFHIMEDSQINAFALPGGNIVVHTGLLLNADSPEEIAGVLAHEMAHVTKQHGVRNIIESVGLFAIVQAFLGDTTGVLATLANNAPMLLTQKFSRDHEREADEQGWNYLLLAKIDPAGMISFFKKLDAVEEKQTASNPLGGIEHSLGFLSTHPATRERISSLEKKHGEMKNADGFLKFNLDFNAFQNTLRAQSGTSAKEEEEQ